MLISHWLTMNQKVLPIGLDIGHSCIKMVQLAHTDGRMKVHAGGMDGHVTGKWKVFTTLHTPDEYLYLFHLDIMRAWLEGSATGRSRRLMVMTVED